jgi:chromosome segregation protein
MRLNKIKLAGFKSFVDPTTIHFPSNLMGIVGPNGCGKSNVIDAIRWVLGESSAKTLRGDSMADVIFNGSSSRKPVGQASIELSFDNTDGTVSGPYASYNEIAVRRVVTRDGVSQYYLNNTRCRRKDITQILLGTGLGSHGYSIIEQGMISRLVEAKPEELRAFLEEAAGISKYKERRRETEHRIRHTRENLERIADVREEIDKQLSNLQRQARSAERYKELKAEERRVSAELLVLRFQSLNAELEQKQSDLNARQTALESAVAERSGVEAAIEKARAAQVEAGEAFNGVQGDYYRVGAEIARLEQSIKHRKETLARQREDLSSTDGQLEEIRGHIANDEVELEQLEQLLNSLSPDLEVALSEQRESEEALNAIEQAMEDWRARRDVLAGTSADVQRTLQVEETRLEQLAAQRDRLNADLDKHRAELAGLAPASVEQRLASLVSNEEKVRAACDEATRGLDSVTHQIGQLREQEKRVSERLDEVRAQLQNDRGRLASLEALQEAALGKVSSQVDKWLSSRALEQSARLAEVLEVQDGWERAVEVALGSYLQAVTVTSVEELASGLAEIGDGSLSLIEAAIRNESLAAASAGATPLSHYVSAPPSAANLLHGIYAVEDLNAALALRAQLGDGDSVITRTGVWLGRHWLRISGRDDPRLGVIARSEEIEKLREVVATASRRADEIFKALADTRTRLEQLEQLRETTQRELARRQQLYAEITSRLSSSRNELAQMQARVGRLGDLVADLTREQESIGGRAALSQEQLASAVAQREEMASRHAALETEFIGLQEQLAAAREKAEQCRERAQSIAIKVESRRSSKESASAALKRVQAQQEHLIRRKAELTAMIESGGEPLAGDEATLTEQRHGQHEVEQKLHAARSRVEAVDQEVRECEHKRASCQNAVDAAREEADATRLSLREVQVRAETVREQFDASGLTFEDVVAGLAEDATTAAWAEQLEAIERKIQRLGAINLAAIEEFEQQSERKKYLDSQYEDLSEALSTLENAIRKIDRETRTKFKDTFDKANQGLSELFPRLFGGGQAYLELESEDLLEAGVSIMARPPGKRISTIHLMSGGEKALTAVALVFSIFELNPAPFCLLDEVDAPLDEANVGRFSDIVREMSKTVQFVIITHNKTTMEAMDQLSGVTMNEPGVSRLVAVDIDEAVQLAAM